MNPEREKEQYKLENRKYEVARPQRKLPELESSE
jgi:hypothetical protein